MKPSHSQIAVLVLYAVFLGAIFLVYNRYMKQVGQKINDLTNIKER